MVILGLFHLLSPTFARKLLVGRNFLRDWEPGPSAERIGIALIRFIIGPTLIILGLAFLFQFLPITKA